MVTVERHDGWWLVQPYRHAPIMVEGKYQHGEDVAGPFDSEQELQNFYMRMDYQYES